MRIRRFFPTFERLFHWWNVRFTPGGKAVSLLAVYSVPAILSFDDAMPFVGLCAVSTLVLTSLLGRMLRPRVLSHMRTPDFAAVGQPFVATVNVENPSKQAALDLLVRFPDRNTDWGVEQDYAQFSLAFGENAEQQLRITPAKRGFAKIPNAAVLTTFPVNLIRKFVAPVEGKEIAVLPRTLPLAVGSNNGIAELLGLEQRMLATAGQGFEYIGSREYREGPVRRWDYSSWARLGQPVVREFAEEADRQVAVLIDTRAPRGRRAKAKAAFEDFICCAFSVIEHLLIDEIEIAVCVVGDTVTTDLARAGNYGHGRIRKLIATTQASRLKDGTTDTAALNQHKDGPVLVFVPDWDSNRESLVDEISKSQSCVRPVVFRADDTEPVPPGVLPVRISNEGICLG